MGFKKIRPYEDVVSERKCQCGKGKILEIHEVYEESDYPPFEHYNEYTKTTCPDNCERIAM